MSGKLADKRLRELIANSERVVRAMGHWPSFHDANLKVTRRSGDACEVVIHVHDMTTEIDAHGFYVSTNHHLLTLRMVGLKESTLPADYRSDVLFGLSAERVGPQIKLVFESAVGSEFTWHAVCEDAVFTDIAPCGFEAKHTHDF